MNAAPTCLIALDLDGTSVRYEPRLEMDPAVVDLLRSLKKQGAAWVMNSDRYTDDMVDIARLLDAEDRPTAILSCQRFISRHDGNGCYRPHSAWNAEQMCLHKDLWDVIAPHFPVWKDTICARFRVLQVVVNDLVFACLVPPDQTDDLRAMLREWIAPWPQAQLSGNHEWSFVLHAAFSKGRLLKKYAELMHLDPGQIIAVGDGINDITMLDGSVTPHVGCPANASPEVIEAVASAGGVVAEGTAAAGTLQILQHYCERLLSP